MHLFILRTLLWNTFLLCLLTGAVPDKPADRILGDWLFPTKGSSVHIYQVGNQYFARVDEVDEAGRQNFGLVKDAVLIQNLRYNGEVWSGGQLVHPKTGIKLSVEVDMNDPNSITVIVYKGLKLFHRTFVMTRKAGSNPR